MGKCTCYPEIDSSFLCLKHKVYLCKECLKCRDPELYCKFRTSCPIWFLEKRGGKELLEENIASRQDCELGP